MKNTFTSLSLNQSASLLLASAVIDLFPGTLFVTGQGTTECFFYDFVFPFPFQKELLTLIEERMRLIMKERRSIKFMEMMPVNAAEMMGHKGQKIVAELLLEAERATVLMCQVGSATLYCEEECSKEPYIPFFKLVEGFSLQVRGRDVIRVAGFAAEDKSIVKQLMKKEPLSSRSHQILAKEASLLSPFSLEDSWMWRPRGEGILQGLIRWWRELHTAQNFSFISSPSSSSEEAGEERLIRCQLEYFLAFGEKRVAEIASAPFLDNNFLKEGFFSPSVGFLDRAYLFCTDQNFLEECISSLHFIMQIPKILDFEYEIVLSVSSDAPKSLRSRMVSLWENILEKEGLTWRVERVGKTPYLVRVELRLFDALGRGWTSPFIGVPLIPMPVGKGCMLVRSLFNSLERFLALLLERNGGWLPLVFSGEQVRVVITASSAEMYARGVCEKLRNMGIRVSVDETQGKSKNVLEKAVRDKVPYLIFLGEKEMSKDACTWCAYGDSREQSLPLDAFCVKLNSDLFNMRSRNSELTH